MDKATKKRWMIWGLLLAATMLAIWAPVPNEENVAQAKSPLVAQVKRSPNLPVIEAVAEDDSESDPFAPRAWEPPPVPPPAVAKPVPVQHQENISPVIASAPPLPFSYMGQLNDEGEQVVYLGRGEQLILVHANDTLEGVYKVLKMSANEIEFLHLPTGEKQILNMNTARP